MKYVYLTIIKYICLFYLGIPQKCTFTLSFCTVYIRVDQIFRLSCLRRHVLGWVKKRVCRNINFFLSAPSCSAGLPKFLRVLNRTPNFFVRNRLCLVSKDLYFDADSNKIDMAQSKNAANWSKIE